MSVDGGPRKRHSPVLWVLLMAAMILASFGRSSKPCGSLTRAWRCSAAFSDGRCPPALTYWVQQRELAFFTLKLPRRLRSQEHRRQSAIHRTLCARSGDKYDPALHSKRPDVSPIAKDPSSRDVHQLKALSDYFFRQDKDNTTVYFYAQGDYGSVPEMLHAESIAAGNWSMSLDRAEKLHEIGAVYRLGDRFKRTSGQNAPVQVHKGEGFRVYLYPRTFPGCYVEDFARRVCMEDKHFVIVDKPPGCPCSPHVSNNLDCLDVAMGASLGLEGLIRLNRLDTVTSGLVTIGKTAQSARIFQEELRNQRIYKVYRALLEAPLPVGPMRHFMASDILHRRPAPRAISTVAHADWKHADSNVISCTPIPFEHLTIEAADHPPSSNAGCYYEVVVELITGRTHQLRAQFAARQAPIVGDTMYKPMSGYLLNDLDDPTIHSLYPLCVEPKCKNGVALQCYQLRFLDHNVSAGDPWWRLRT